MGIVHALFDLIYRDYCAACAEKLCYGETHICSGCAANVRVNTPPFCEKCARPLPGAMGICRECGGKESHLERVWSWGIYEGVLRECICALKYRNKPDILDVFYDRIAGFCSTHSVFSFPDIIVPIPMHHGESRFRRHNQARTIAFLLSGLSGMETRELLIKREPTYPQHFLSKQDRIINISGAFTVRRAGILRNKKILLVDDILTTGATLNEGAKTLLNAGAKAVCGFTIARGRYNEGDNPNSAAP
ncbi:MAG: ComF family protein [Candidatus Omnitrophota bacterium]